MQGRSVDLVRIEVDHDAIHEAIVRWRSAPKNAQYFTEEFPGSLEAHMMWFYSAREDPTQRYYAIVARPQPCGCCALGPIGTISLYNINWCTRRAEFGRFLIGDESNRRRGYGSEALFLLLRHAFRCMNLHRIWLQTLVASEVAHRLYKKMGFVGEGILRKHLWKDGHYVDIHVMGLLAEDFHEREEALREELGLT